LQSAIHCNTVAGQLLILQRCFARKKSPKILNAPRQSSAPVANVPCRIGVARKQTTLRRWSFAL
jgi:hypothetical protein